MADDLSQEERKNETVRGKKIKHARTSVAVSTIRSEDFQRTCYEGKSFFKRNCSRRQRLSSFINLSLIELAIIWLLLWYYYWVVETRGIHVWFTLCRSLLLHRQDFCMYVHSCDVSHVHTIKYTKHYACIPAAWFSYILHTENTTRSS